MEYYSKENYKKKETELEAAKNLARDPRIDWQEGQDKIRQDIEAIEGGLEGLRNLAHAEALGVEGVHEKLARAVRFYEEMQRIAMQGLESARENLASFGKSQMGKKEK